MKILLSEANLSNLNDLIDAINKILDGKNIPQFAGGEANKIRDWFLKKYVQSIKSDEIDLANSIKPHRYTEDEPEWMNKPDIVDFSGTLPNEIVDEINHIIDYFATLEPNDLRKVDREPYRVVKQKVKDWEEEQAEFLRTGGEQEAEKKKQLKANVDYKLIKDYGDGFKWVKLITPVCKDFEGEYMGHCVGGGQYEDKDIYSLWDKNNRSHITIETDDSAGEIKQIKGKQNRAPVEKYKKYAIDFVAQLVADNYDVTRDGENVDMVKHGEQYYFDDLSVLPEKYRNNANIKKWVDQIYPTVVYPKQQKAIADLIARIREV